ncbi:gluconate transporter [Methylocella silvestris BL2]|uniref:Gluconate transporter n=1 Tax=Methylocella silvestris (strain DSM 15510 / CIP 108128 / LMG 27833 / NCIMB 13906 / BL2) TaxID=395965 RepID=B8EKQ9_METSB|nr:GntP family permease [Methylocella silvestris]ACK51937.1 gluconate transporter [Methylocella silvestris BL2]
MSEMTRETYLLLDAAVTIVGLVLLITKFKVHPFVALILASVFLGLTSGMAADLIMKSFQEGFGGVLGFVGIVLGLGTMLGKLMAESGGADQIAQTLIRSFGRERVHWAMMLAAFLVGIPLFFEIGFVLLIPLVFIVARRSGVPLIKVGIPLLAGLSAVHGLVPPHPGPLLTISVFGADIGKTILYGLIVGLPAAAVAGPIFGSFISRSIPGHAAPDLADQFVQDTKYTNLPSFSVTLTTILLPVFLMLLKALADVLFATGSPVRVWMDLIGHPITALLAALLLAFYTFGSARGFSREQLGKLLDASLTPIAAIMLIVGAGGGFKQMLVASGVGDVIGHLAVRAEVSPILLAWLVAAVIRIATGSATVATITGAGIVAPVVALAPGVNRELLVLATGAGSVVLSHVNDAGFWLVKQYFNMTVVETFKTWTVMETILSVVSLGLILLLAHFV